MLRSCQKRVMPVPMEQAELRCAGTHNRARTATPDDGARVRALVVKALEHHPEARRAVVEALLAGPR